VAGPRVLLDTNVLVAAMRSRRGASFQVVSEIGHDRFEFVLTVPLVLEYEKALTDLRPPGVSRTEIQAFLDYLCLEAQLHEVFYLWRPVLRDYKDDLVLEAAVAGNCKIIVTHNQRHFGGAVSFGIAILSPAEFFGRLELQDEQP
jgi:predicted nucleic acid-binding protein